MSLFTDQEKELIQSLGIEPDYDNLSDDIIIEIEEKVADHLQLYGFDEDYWPTKLGRLCEGVLDKVADL